MKEQRKVQKERGNKKTPRITKILCWGGCQRGKKVSAWGESMGGKKKKREKNIIGD